MTDNAMTMEKEPLRSCNQKLPRGKKNLSTEQVQNFPGKGISRGTTKEELTKAIATELKLWNWSTGKRPTGDDELDCEEKTR